MSAIAYPNAPVAVGDLSRPVEKSIIFLVAQGSLLLSVTSILVIGLTLAFGPRLGGKGQFIYPVWNHVSKVYQIEFMDIDRGLIYAQSFGRHQLGRNLVWSPDASQI